MRFAGRHVLTTGGSSGIGLAIAREFARAGCHIHIAARRGDALDRAIAKLEALRTDASQGFSAHSCDISVRAEVASLFSTLRAQGWSPSIVVNSAGVTRAGYFQQVPTEDFARVMQVNYFGTLYVLKEAVPEMLAAGEGCILNVSSIAGLLGVFGFSPYCAAKFAVCGLTQTLRSELKPHGIQVSLLCPPDTDTPMLRADADNPPETKALSKTGGVLTPEQVARAAIHGLRRRKAIIVPGLEGKLVTVAQRFAPGLVERVGDWMTRRAAGT
jgi:3-dehydrosphinganine reductase